MGRKENLIRVVEGEPISPELAKKIMKKEPQNVTYLTKEKVYIYRSYLSKPTPKPDGSYIYQAYQIIDVGLRGKRIPTKKPLVLPRKVFYFDENGVRQKGNAFVDIYGNEKEVSGEYDSFIEEAITNNGQIINSQVSAAHNKRKSLNIFLNESADESESYYAEVFTLYLLDYVTNGTNLLLDSDGEVYLSCFANDTFYNAVVNEERRRWVEQVAPKKKANPNLDVKSLKETKTYLKHKQQIAQKREDALKLFAGV